MTTPIRQTKLVAQQTEKKAKTRIKRYKIRDAIPLVSTVNTCYGLYKQRKYTKQIQDKTGDYKKLFDAYHVYIREKKGWEMAIIAIPIIGQIYHIGKWCLGAKQTPNLLGLMHQQQYEDGCYFLANKEPEKGISLLQQAAFGPGGSKEAAKMIRENPKPHAQYHDKIGDYSTGLRYWEIAAKAQDAEASLRMAKYYREGNYINKDLQLAKLHIENAIKFCPINDHELQKKIQDEKRYIKSENFFNDPNEKAIPVNELTPSRKKGLALLKKIGETGDVDALIKLAQHYDQMKDIKTGLIYWKRAAHLKDMHAALTVAQTYDFEMTQNLDDKETAIKYYQLALTVLEDDVLRKNYIEERLKNLIDC